MSGTSGATRAAGGAATASPPGWSVAPVRVALKVGHCYVELVEFAGRRWGLHVSEQFGWGGPQYYPENWSGIGVLAKVAPDLVRYTDDGGAELSLLPARSPAVARAEATPCR